MSENQQSQVQIIKETKPEYSEKRAGELPNHLNGQETKSLGKKPSKMSDYFGRKGSDSKAADPDHGQPLFSVAQPSDRFQATGNFPGSELIFLDDVGQDGSLRRTYYKSIDQMSEVIKAKPSKTGANSQPSSQFDQASQYKKKSPRNNGATLSGKTSQIEGLVSAHDPRIETALLDETSILSNLEVVKQRSVEERSAGPPDPRSRSKQGNRLSSMKENSYPSPHVAHQLDFGRSSGGNSQSRRKMINRESGELPEYLSADSREIREALKMQASETPEGLDESYEGRTVHGYTEIKHRMINDFGEELVLDSSASNQKQRKLLIPSHSSRSISNSSKTDPKLRTQTYTTSLNIRNGNLMCSRSTQTEIASGNLPLFASSLCIGCLNASNLQPLQLSFGTNGNLDNTNSKDSARQERLKFEYDKMSYQPSRRMIQDIRQIHQNSTMRNRFRNPNITEGLNHHSEFLVESSSGSKGGIRIYDPFVQKRKLIRQKATESGTGKKSNTQSNLKADQRSSRPSNPIGLKPESASIESKPTKQSPLKINQKSYLSNFESKLSFYENSDIKYFSLERKRSRERTGEDTTDRQRPTEHNTGRSYLSGSKSTQQLNQAGTYTQNLENKHVDPEVESANIKRIFEADSRMHGKETSSNISLAVGQQQYYLAKGLGGVSRKLASEFSRDHQKNRSSNEIVDPGRYQRRKSSSSALSNSQSRIKIKHDRQQASRPDHLSRNRQAQEAKNLASSKLSASQTQHQNSRSYMANTSSSQLKAVENSVAATSDKGRPLGATRSTAATARLRELSSVARLPDPAAAQVSVSPFDPVAASTRVVGPPSKKGFPGSSQHIQIPISLNINLAAPSGPQQGHYQHTSSAGSHMSPSGTTAAQHQTKVSESVRPHPMMPAQQQQQQLQAGRDPDDSWALFEHELSLTLRQAEDARGAAMVAAEPRKQLFDGFEDARPSLLSGY